MAEEPLSINRPQWRLLRTAPGKGAWNMAVDEAMSLLVGEGRAPFTLRLYRWRPPCLSLGYFQEIGRVDLEACARRGVDVVRRPTGGKAILHDGELTYSLVVAEGEPQVAGSVVESYCKISAGLIAGLRRLGVLVELGPAQPNPSSSGGGSLCFETPSDHELVAVGRKIVGSAQMRRNGVILQHGSIPLDFAAARLLELFNYPDQERVSLQEILRQRATSLNEILGRPVGVAEVEAALVVGFQEALGVNLFPGDLQPNELKLADELIQRRYSTRDWLHRR